MRKLTLVKAKQAELKKLQDEVKKLESSEDYKAEVAFLTDVEKVLKKHNKTIGDAISVLTEQIEGRPASRGRPRRSTEVKAKTKTKTPKYLYTNPNLADSSTAKTCEWSGNEKRRVPATVTKWRKKHSMEEIQSWRGKRVN